MSTLTARELIQKLEEDIELIRGLAAPEFDLDTVPVYAGNTGMIGEGGISWFTVVGVMHVHTPDGGIIIELDPSGYSDEGR